VTATSAPDVVVVGGGIVGVCTALQLQRSGRQVTVVERGTPGDEASGHNGGMFSGDVVPTSTPEVIRSLPKLITDPYSPLVLRPGYLLSLAPWLIRFALASRPSRVEANSTALATLTMPGFDAYRPLVEGTKAKDLIENIGCLYGYIRGELLDPNEHDLRLRARRGVKFEIVDRDGIGRISPSLARLFEAGIYFPDSRYTKDPKAFTQALLDDFLARGGRCEQAEVVGFQTSRTHVDGVRTRTGKIAAGAVALTAGPWSRALLRQLGTDVPLEVERGYGIDIPNPGIDLDVPIVIADNHSALTPHRSGVRICGIDELASISAPADLSVIDRMVRGAKVVYPELSTRGATTWMRRRPSMPDSLPVIGRAPRYENVWLNLGHGHKGLGTGAITGKLVRELMDGAPPSVDVSPFRPTRFAFGG
jgi:D-amino-acid dehydrogenase